ncbi:MAG: serine protease Do [Lachnospiraceae bacterium]|jgi:S1-C subfamily serine protease|nr:serine protease Do [Lachnospiraceae bacterium]
MKRLKYITIAVLFLFIISVTVPGAIPAQQNYVHAEAATVSISQKNVSLYIKETAQLKMNGTTKTVTWTSSNKKIATVSTKGKVTAISEGKATITAKVGTKQYTSNIEVKAKELTPVEVYAAAKQATVEIIANVSDLYYNLGSGFFIDNGIIVTNYHVIEGANKIQITTYDNKAYEVEQVLGYDKFLDIAILKVDSTNQFLKVNERGVTVGQQIFIIGSPLGLTGTFADGLVASDSRVIDNVEYIQVTAPMSQGNSGGPLLNVYGEVMGINTWQYVDGQNLNFSINIAETEKVDTSNPITVLEFYSRTVDYSNQNTESLSYDSILAWINQSSLSNTLDSTQETSYLYQDNSAAGGQYIIIIPR